MNSIFSHNFLANVLRIIARILKDFFYFPLWWYGPGLLGFIRSLGLFLRDRESARGLGIWLKNILVPMYGQSDFSGRIISFVMRLVQVVFRGSVLAVWLVIALLSLVVWLALPLFLLLALASQFASMK